MDVITLEKFLSYDVVERGEVVCIDRTSRNRVLLASASDVSRMPAIGFVTSVKASGVVSVQTSGYFRVPKTYVEAGSGLEFGVPLYVSDTPGRITTAPPQANQQIVAVWLTNRTVQCIPSPSAYMALTAQVENIVLPKTSGKGIRVDHVSPTFGFADILGNLNIRSAGANDPTFAVFRGNLRQFQFSNAGMRKVYMEYHIPHDYLPGSDIFVHVHWSQIVVDTGGPAGVPGNVKWQFDLSYAKGHGQAAFTAPVSSFVIQQASSVQYQHMLTEVAVSTPGGAVDRIDTSLMEPDGVLLVRAFRIPTDVVDTLNQAPFVHYVDLHYQTTGVMGTKQNFYI